MTLLSREDYLDWASVAFHAVRAKMVKGAANRHLDQPKDVSVLERLSCVSDERKLTKPLIFQAREEELEVTRGELRQSKGEEWYKVITKQEREEAGAETDTRIWRRRIDINNDYALIYGCGNCEEQSSVTFKYLQARLVKPLDYIELEGFMGFGDHAFVILGRDGKTDVKKISTWNREAAWCDPYENEWGGLEKIKARFGEGGNLSLRYRWGDP
jgi:hypothetical protein